MASEAASLIDRPPSAVGRYNLSAMSHAYLKFINHLARFKCFSTFIYLKKCDFVSLTPFLTPQFQCKIPHHLQTPCTGVFHPTHGNFLLDFDFLWVPEETREKTIHLGHVDSKICLRNVPKMDFSFFFDSLAPAGPAIICLWCPTAVLFPSLPPGRFESVYEVPRRFCFLPDVMIMLLIVSACSEIMQDYMLLVSACSEFMYDYMTNSYLEICFFWKWRIFIWNFVFFLKMMIF